eukprot:11493758-Alexandrium_andersonii.AAC.1
MARTVLVGNSSQRGVGHRCAATPPALSWPGTALGSCVPSNVALGGATSRARQCCASTRSP